MCMQVMGWVLPIRMMLGHTGDHRGNCMTRGIGDDQRRGVIVFL